MTARSGPISLSIWDEPGLEIEGFAEPPTAMMGHHRPEYQAWIEAAGYDKAKDLITYELDIEHWDDPKIDRLIAMGETQSANPHPPGRQVEVQRGSAADPQPPQRCLVGQLGLCPADRGRDRLCRQEAEADHLSTSWCASPKYDGEPVAFMLTIPDINELTKDLNGELFPFGFVKLLWRLRKPRTRRAARAADGRGQEAARTRLASQLAFMLIEYTRREGVSKYGVENRRVRLDPRGQQGNAVDRRIARRAR